MGENAMNPLEMPRCIMEAALLPGLR